MNRRPDRLLLARARAFGWDSLVHNGLLMLLTAGVNLAAGFAFLYVASHHWSPHDVGISASVMSAILLASTLADIGLGTTLIQELAKQKEDREWSTILNTFLIAGGCAAFIAGIATVFLTQRIVPATSALIDSPGGVATVIAGVVLITLGGLLGAACIAERRADISLALSVAYQLLRLVILVSLARVVQGPIGIAGSAILAACITVPVGLVLCIPLARSGHSRIAGIDLRVVRNARGTFGGHYLINLTGAVPLVVMPLMIASRISPSDAAYYYAAWALAGSLCSIAGAVAASLFVEGSHVAGALPRLVRRSAILTVCLLAPAMVIAVALGPTALSLFGERYASHATTLFFILVVSALPQAATTIYVSTLRVAGRLRYAVALYVGTGLVAIAGAWVLLPEFGISGVGVAWLLAQSFGAALAGAAWLRARAPSRGAIAPSAH